MLLLGQLAVKCELVCKLALAPAPVQQVGES
jgi:hypothetical protein